MPSNVTECINDMTKFDRNRRNFALKWLAMPKIQRRPHYYDEHFVTLPIGSNAEYVLSHMTAFDVVFQHHYSPYYVFYTGTGHSQTYHHQELVNSSKYCLLRVS